MIKTDETKDYVRKDRPYFYKDKDGKLQKYLYCSLCNDGPFEQESPNLTYITGESQKIFWCKKCNMAKRIDLVSKENIKVMREEGDFVKVKDKKTSIKADFAKLLLDESVGKVMPSQEGIWFNILAQAKNKKIYSFYHEGDPDQFIDDMNNEVVVYNSMARIQLPLTLLYKRGCETKVEAESIDEVFKVKQADFKLKLIANYDKYVSTMVTQSS
jgi:hypothetical protein